jgi:hypothetical protein
MSDDRMPENVPASLPHKGGRVGSKRYKARNHCSECGAPTYNDVDDAGVHHGMVCMDAGQGVLTYTPCSNYLKRAGSSKNEYGDYSA